MTYKFFQSLALAFTLMISTASYAQNDPQQTLRLSIDGLLAEFTAHRAELEADKTKLYSFAEKVIDEHWDFAKMAQLVLGKSWRKISDDQKARFTKAFKSLLVRTYASAMFKYTGKEAVTLEAPVYKGKKNNRATVNANGTLGEGSPNIPLSFSLFSDEEEKWRIYNVAIAGVSLVTTYRSSYNQIIAAKGIDYLIDSINRKAG